MKTQQKIADDIMKKFKEDGSRPGHVFNERWMNFTYFLNLNPEEQKLVEPALHQLIVEGKIEQKDGRLHLSQGGYDHNFPDNEEEGKSKIKKAVWNWFSKNNSKVGHILPKQWLSNSLPAILNPKEKELINHALKEMSDEGYIEEKQTDIGYAVALTQKGYDFLYK